MIKQISIFLFALSVYSGLHLKASSADTIDTSQSIRDNQTLVSAGDFYELGFFNSQNSDNWYLGIWYKNVPGDKTVVWVANRDTPLSNRSAGVLRVVPPGRLILVNATNATIWSSNSSGTVPSPIAQLTDSGNLVVRDASDDRPENYLWQSFDHPTDTFMHGMQFGLSSVYLTSWKTTSDPAPGEFLCYMDQSGYPQVFIQRNRIDRYRVGPWNGLVFSGLPYVRDDPSFVFGVHKNEDGVFYLRENSVDRSVISRVYLNPNGALQRQRWVPQTQTWVFQLSFPVDNCDAYNSCGAYGQCVVGNFPLCQCLDKFEPKDPRGWREGDWSSNGCVRRTPLDCQAGDGFIRHSNLKLPDARRSRYDENLTLQECRVECMRNCSCMAYAVLNVTGGGSGSGCLHWFGDLMDIRVLSVDADGQDLYIRMASSEVGSNGNRTTLIIASLTSVGAVLLILCLLLLFMWKRRKNRNGRRAETEDFELPSFDLSKISKATDNFAFQNKLGEGGYGPVYKGTIEVGQEIAVKRLSETSKQGLIEFKNEAILIAKLQHRNLVKLLGYCIEGEEKMLIYEYMPNKSLDTILFDQKNRMALDWPKRFNIASGIARGLVYLHQDSRLRIIHRDLKASNILLDRDMNPKISDFGIARMYSENEAVEHTNRVVGTYGYMSPEYAVAGRYSIKSDVFSFGVIVLEIVSGKRNSAYSVGDRNLNLLGHAWTLHSEGRSMELADSYLQVSDNNLGQVVRLIHVGLLCVQHHPDDRPTMPSVVTMLSNDSELPQPNQPGFFTDVGVGASASSNASTNPVSSTNEMTITLLGGR